MNIQKYLDGEELIGDDYSLDQIGVWAKEEMEAYANLGAKDKSGYAYKYHELNRMVGFSCVDLAKCQNVLGVGSAWGEEFAPIEKYIKDITILESSEIFSSNFSKIGLKAKYVKPTINNSLPFEDNSFDLIVCFGVLHHIPNVSFMLKEFYRCINSKGLVIVREPIISMGDWSGSRAGLTKNERGIPLEIFRGMIKKCGFYAKKEKLCMFQPLRFLSKFSRIDIYNNKFFTIVDLFLCKIFFWNVAYHKTRIWQKFGPSSIYYVLQKT